MTTLKYLTLCIALIVMEGCKTGGSNKSSKRESGMFRVAILYPGGENKTFDMAYYEKTHMPMVAGFIGKNLSFYEIDRGIAGRTSNDTAPFVAIGYFYIQDVADYNKAIAKNRDAIVSDFKNYTNIQPVIQISEIKKISYVDSR